MKSCKLQECTGREFQVYIWIYIYIYIYKIIYVYTYIIFFL